MSGVSSAAFLTLQTHVCGCGPLAQRPVRSWEICCGGRSDLWPEIGGRRPQGWRPGRQGEALQDSPGEGRMNCRQNLHLAAARFAP
jgi:hypothetical protein